MHFLPLGLLLTAVFTSPTDPSPAPADDKKVRSTFDAFVAQINAQNQPGMLAYFAKDAVLIHPRRGEATYDEIAADMARRSQPAAGPKPDVKTEVKDLKVEGDMAVLRILWTTAYTDAQGTPRTRQEKDLEVWVRRGGEWKLWRGLSFPVEPAAAK